MKYALSLALSIGLLTIGSLAFPHQTALAWLDTTIGTSFAQKDDDKNAVASPAVPVLITTLGVALTENFDTLSNTAGSTTNNLTIPGWEMNETGGGARDNEQYAVDTGGGNTGDTFSYGTAGATDRALGSLQSGTLISTIGASFTNNTGVTITSLDIAYVGEQWRIANTAAARDDRYDFQYSLDATSLTTGTWTDANTLDFTNPIKTSASASALDGNAVANRTGISATIAALSIPNGATFYIRWTDLNASGADDGLAVDDFSLTAQTVLAAPATISGRVVTPQGRAISKASILVTDQNGESRVVVTNSFGYFNAAGLASGQSYVVSVSARGYTFANSSYVVDLSDNIGDLNFVSTR